jgi:hypothetical protein
MGIGYLSDYQNITIKILPKYLFRNINNFTFAGYKYIKLEYDFISDLIIPDFTFLGIQNNVD